MAKILGKKLEFLNVITANGKLKKVNITHRAVLDDEAFELIPLSDDGDVFIAIGTSKFIVKTK